jgi:hypothetical protein
MKRSWPYVLLALFVGAFSFRLAFAALSPAALLPIVRNGQAPPAQTTITTLVSDDCSFVSAINIPSTDRVLISYIDRAHGNLLHVVEDLGDHVVEVAAPIVLEQLTIDPSPAFTPPGPKQADSALVIAAGKLNLYFTGRIEANGPFVLQRLTMPIPPAPIGTP